MSQQYIHEKGKGKGGYFQQQGNPVFQNGRKSIPDSYLKKSGRGPMPYNSNNQKGQYSSVYKNMKDMQNNANNDFWSTKSFEKTLESFDLDDKYEKDKYLLRVAYDDLESGAKKTSLVWSLTLFFKNIEWLIEYADDIADRSVDKLELYETVDKLKLYRKHIKDMYYEQCKNSPDLKNVYLEEDSELGTLDVFEPGVKVIAPKEEDRTAELRLVGLDTDEYNIFCSVNESDKDKRAKYKSATNKINKYKENLTKQPVYDAEKSAVAKCYFANDTTLNVNAPAITEVKGMKARDIFFQLFYEDIYKDIKDGNFVDKDVENFVRLAQSGAMSFSAFDDYIFKKSDLLKRLLKKSLDNAKKEKGEYIQEKFKFLYLYDLLQDDKEKEIIPKNPLYDVSGYIYAPNNGEESIDNYFYKNFNSMLIDHLNMLKKPLFQGNPSASDIHQAYIGDCYLMAALISLIKHPNYGPQFIRNMMRDNQDGTVTVRLYRVSWDEIQNRNKYDLQGVDSHPVHIKVPKTGLFNNTESALWVQILEKAYALVRGNNLKYKVENKIAHKNENENNENKENYRKNLGIKTVSSLDAGRAYCALKTLTGEPTKRLTNKEIFELDCEEMWKLAKNNVCTVAFKNDFKLTDINRNKINISSYHAYSLKKGDDYFKFILIDPHDGDKEIIFYMDADHNLNNFELFYRNIKCFDYIV